jgi:hypothetical protein
MGFEWASKKADQGVATIYESQITLNKAASSHLDTAKKVLLGLNMNEHKVAIKPLSKEEVDLAIYPDDQMFNISISSSYARVSNKDFIRQILLVKDMDLSHNNSMKFDAVWSHEENALIIDLTKETEAI